MKIFNEKTTHSTSTCIAYIGRKMWIKTLLRWLTHTEELLCVLMLSSF